MACVRASTMLHTHTHTHTHTHGCLRDERHRLGVHIVCLLGVRIVLFKAQQLLFPPALHIVKICANICLLRWVFQAYQLLFELTQALCVLGLESERERKRERGEGERERERKKGREGGRGGGRERRERERFLGANLHQGSLGWFRLEVSLGRQRAGVKSHFSWRAVSLELARDCTPAKVRLDVNE